MGKRGDLSLAVVLLIVLLAILWRPFRFPFDIEPEADQSFSETITQKDNTLTEILSKDDKGFARAIKPREFMFPQDHGAHPQFRSEWWYFTGNLQTSHGRKFGYELTFFRFALASDIPVSKSSWRNNQLYMAHLTLTDVKTKRFYNIERYSRAGNDLAGTASDRFQVWLYDWSAKAENREDFPLHLQAKTPQFGIDLHLTKQKGPVLQGNQGLSQKSSESGNASYYYSYSRLATEGWLDVGGKSFAIAGNSWMDREWSSSALSDEQSGWDWFALQFSDNTELMFYRLRRKDGKVDSHSAGSIVLDDGSKISLGANDVSIATLDKWKSPHSKISYPSRWQITVPDQHIQVTVMPLIDDQELNLGFRYWEGAVTVSGGKNGAPISGQGYVELVGYQ